MWAEDTALMCAALYMMILGTATAATYQKLKQITHRGEFRRRDDPEWAHMPREPDWRDDVFPLLIAGALTALFLPVTMFTFLPFASRWVETDWMLSAVIVSRTANGSYEGFRSLGEFLSGLIGRIQRWG